MEISKANRELLENVKLEDIAEGYHQIIEIVGLKKFVELSNLARGERLYFPKVESIVLPARNRKIKKEYDGRNAEELAQKYNLTVRQIRNILKDEPIAGQMNIMDLLK